MSARRMRVDSLPFISSCWGRSCCLTSRLRTSNDYLSNLAVGDVPYVLALGETPCASGRGLLAGIARLLGVLQALWAKNAKYEYCCCCSAILLPQNNGHKVNMFINASTYKPDTELIEQCGGAYKLQERCFGSFWMLLKK